MGLEKQLSTFRYQDMSAVLPPVSAAVVVSDSIKLHGPLLVLINKLQTYVLQLSLFILDYAFLHLKNDENASSPGLQLVLFYVVFGSKQTVTQICCPQWPQK